jgi:N-acetylmuramoyl-L-alanine amidase
MTPSISRERPVLDRRRALVRSGAVLVGFAVTRAAPAAAAASPPPSPAPSPSPARPPTTSPSSAPTPAPGVVRAGTTRAPAPAETPRPATIDAARTSDATGGVHGGTTDIVAVRLWPAHDYTRVTLESTQPLSATHRLHDQPDRLSIDIDGLDLGDTLRELVSKVRADDPFIAAVRVSQFKPRVVRMVLDLKQPVAPQVFTLKPVAAYRHRLVFDLHPTLEPDPLLALVRRKEAAERQAAASVRDALGELIDRIEGPHARSRPPPAGSSAGSPASAEDGRSKDAQDAQARSPSPSLPGPPPVAQTRVPSPSPDAASKPGKVDRLVIVALDPGHGGEDPGAIGPGGLREKDVVLAIALALRDRLESVPGMRAFLTRDADFFVPLQERVRKARRVQADLFVSIHADAAERREARGASVFALSEGGASSSTARWLARRENAADAVGGVNINARLRRDPQAFKTVLEMTTAAQIKDSKRLGQEVLGQLDRVGDLHKPHVEQAGFAVLKAPDIPSILVETAFISNPREEARLRDAGYRERLVDALHHGIRRYFAKNPPLARQRTF